MLKVYDVMVNSKLVQCGDETILFGIPPEIVKPIQAKKLANPTSVIITDRVIIDNNFQNSVEFVFYYYLFISQDFFIKKKKLKILGYDYQLDNNQKLLNLCLFGLEREDYLKIGLPEKLVDSFILERNYFSLKDENNIPNSLDHYIESYPFNTMGLINLGDVVIKHLNINVYEVSYKGFKEIIDLNSQEKQKPPYDIVESNFYNLDKFSVKALGGSSGFSPTKSSASFILSYNGDLILIDAIPYLDDHLLALGISKGQISCVFLSHIHDDHCNLASFIFSWNKISIITTTEIFWMAMYKTALLLDISISEVSKYFNFIPLQVGYVLDYYGLHIRPHYTVHTIPTIGCKFSIFHEKKEYSIIVIGDNSSLQEAKLMFKKGIISHERLENIKSIYNEETDLLFADGGEGPIHGSPKDVFESKAKRVIFYNLDFLSKEFTRKFSIVNTGNCYTLIPGGPNFYITKIIGFLTKIIGKFNLYWLSAFLGNLEIVHYNKNDVILTQGDLTDGFVYLIITGYCEVSIYKDNHLEVVAIKEAGDLFGEIALFENEKKRNASIIAYSSVSLCRLDGNIFRSFVYKENKLFQLSKSWNILSVLRQIGFFKNFSNRVIQSIAKFSYVLEYHSKTKITLTDIGLLIVIDGRVSRYKKKGVNIVLELGDYFITKKFSFNKLKLDIDEKLFAIVVSNKDLKRIINDHPEFAFVLRNRDKIRSFLKKEKFL